MKNKYRYRYKIEEKFYWKGFLCVVILIKITNADSFDKFLSYYIDNKFKTEWRCGYVGVSKKHVLYGKDYTELDDYDFRVNGGLTFSGFRKELMKNKKWYFGFDFNHSWNTKSNSKKEVVIKQVKRLANQLQQDNLILKNLR